MLADFEAQVAAGQVTVLEAAGRLHGLIVMFPEADHLFVENVAVWPDAQGHGYGRRLLVFAESEARRLGLHEIQLYTEERMTENLTLYPAIGYEQTVRRKRRATGGSTSGRSWTEGPRAPARPPLESMRSQMLPRAGTGGMRSLSRVGSCPSRCS